MLPKLTILVRNDIANTYHISKNDTDKTYQIGLERYILPKLAKLVRIYNAKLAVLVAKMCFYKPGC